MLDVSRLQKTKIPGYFKDPVSGAVINTNDEQLTTYLHGREKAKQLIELKDNYSKLTNELDEIKRAIGLK